MKLLIITQKVDKNDGVLGFMHRWLVEFSRCVEELTVICLFEGAHDLPANVRVLSLGKERDPGRASYLWRFYRLIWRERKEYDAVFVHMNQLYVILGAPLWKALGKKISLWYAHGRVSISLRLAEKLADVIFSPSLASFRLPSKKLVVTGHGIDTQSFKAAGSVPAGAPIVTIGRISPIKDYATLINAMAELRHQHDPARLEIIGGPATESDKRYADKLIALVAERGLNNRIAFSGEIPNDQVPDALASAALFVNLSKTGSIDKAVLEAMACGVPIITSNEAFLPMFKQHGLADADLISEPGNARDLAEKMKALLISPDRQELGRELRDIVVQEHNLSSLVRRIVSLLQ